MKPIPSLADLYTKLASDLKTRLNLTDSDLQFVLDAMATVLGAQFKLCYLYLQDIQNNQFPDTADTVANGGTLERQGLIYLNRLPFPAIAGVYTANVTGVNGAVLRAQLTFQSDQNSNAPSNLYILDNEYDLTGTTGVITLRSLNPGVDFLLNVGDVLIPTEPVLGIDQSVVIASVTTAPEDGEDIDVYRQAILNAIRLEPQGGAKTDYRIWAADANGVRLVYPYVKQGEAGTVQVYVEAVTVDSTDGHGTPSAGLLTDVGAVIEFSPDETLPTNDRGRRPIQANVEVLPISPTPVDLQIQGLQTNTSAVRSSISSNVSDYFYGIRPYIAGADLPRDKNDILTAVKLQSVITDTIGTANTFLGFTMFVDGVGVNSYTFALAHIPYLRNITYI